MSAVAIEALLESGTAGETVTAPSGKVNSRASYFLLGSTAAEILPAAYPSAMAYEKIIFSAAPSGVDKIALNEPDTRNALSDDLLGELLVALEACRDDPVVRCVVLTSTHHSVFSSGGNLGGFAADVPLVHKHFATSLFPEVFALLGQLGKPSICAANGHVLAGALGLALACDLVIASETARFGTPEINIGLFPFMIMALIYRNVGRKKTAELMLMGEQVSAVEAERIGLVNRGVPAAEGATGVAAWAGE